MLLDMKMARAPVLNLRYLNHLAKIINKTENIVINCQR